MYRNFHHSLDKDTAAVRRTKENEHWLIFLTECVAGTFLATIAFAVAGLRDKAKKIFEKKEKEMKERKKKEEEARQQEKDLKVSIKLVEQWRHDLVQGAKDRQAEEEATRAIAGRGEENLHSPVVTLSLIPPTLAAFNGEEKYDYSLVSPEDGPELGNTLQLCRRIANLYPSARTGTATVSNSKDNGEVAKEEPSGRARGRQLRLTRLVEGWWTVKDLWLAWGHKDNRRRSSCRVRRWHCHPSGRPYHVHTLPFRRPSIFWLCVLEARTRHIWP